jgi:uncharacterized protein (TIRG00374 family)
VLKCSLTTGILCYVFAIIPLENVFRSIRSAKFFYIIAALSITILATFISAYRLKLLTDKQGMTPSVTQIVRINFITCFYGLLLPGYLASGVIRWHKLSLIDNKKTEAAAAIIYSRINYTIIIIILGIIFLALDVTNVPQTVTILSLLALLTSLLIVYFLAFNPKSLLLFDRLYHSKAHFIPVSLYNMISNLMVSNVKYHDLSRKSFFFIIGVTLMENMLIILSMYCLAIALNIDISIINIGWVRSIINIITTLPISFSGVGLREGGFIVLLKTYGVSGANAVTLSFLVFAMTLFIAGIGGLIEAKNLLCSSKPRG